MFALKLLSIIAAGTLSEDPIIIADTSRSQASRNDCILEFEDQKAPM
jgi:hypothetical protein